jgi:hypothetical protein
MPGWAENEWNELTSEDGHAAAMNEKIAARTRGEVSLIA